MLKWTQTRQALNQYGKYLVAQSKRNLTKNKMGGSKLYRSLRSVVNNPRDKAGRFSSGEPQLTIYMNYYGKFVDEGVRGTKDKDPDRGAKPNKFNKNKKAINLKAAESFIQKKTGFRRMRKQSRKSLVFLIARSIHQKGIKRSLFFSKALLKRSKVYTDKITASAANDITNRIVTIIKSQLNGN